VAEFPQNGYLYVACNARKYLEEAVVSVRSLRKHNPGAHVTVIVDALLGECRDLLADFDHVVVSDVTFTLESEWKMWKTGLLFKVSNMYEFSPYEHTCFLDTDTHCLGKTEGLFAHLDYFDLAVVHASRDRKVITVEGHEIQGLTSFNTGVMLFRRNESVADLFAKWRSCYEAHVHNMKHDQLAFVEALATSKCRLYVLQNNWNARYDFPEKYVGKVVILHGRRKNPEKMGRRINTTQLERIWFPKIQYCVYRSMGIWARLNFAVYFLILSIVWVRAL
jgi:hypothetical protein